MDIRLNILCREQDYRAVWGAGERLGHFLSRRVQVRGRKAKRVSVGVVQKVEQTTVQT